MDEKVYKDALTSIFARLTRLENEFKELRHYLPIQKLQVEPSRVISTSDSMEIAAPISRAATSYWTVTCFGRFHMWCSGRELTFCSSRRGRSILKYLLA